MKDMDPKILVTYASTHGSTQEVAEQIAETLREQGQPLELRPAREVRSLDGYSAVVLGAPLYMFHWHRDAQRFLARFRTRLAAGMPVAIFSGGPFGKGDEAEWREVRGEVDKERAKYPWLQPVSVEVIGGKFDPAHLRFPWNLAASLEIHPGQRFARLERDPGLGKKPANCARAISRGWQPGLKARETMKILVLCASYRRNGNTDQLLGLVKEHLQAEAERRHAPIEIETVYLGQANLGFCRGCRICYDRGEAHCPNQDDLLAIKAKLLAAEGILFASPVYVDDVSGIAKNFIDRLCHVCHRPQFAGKAAYLIATTGSTRTSKTLGTLKLALQTWGVHVMGQAGFQDGRSHEALGHARAL